jgi:hypothetical protein
VTGSANAPDPAGTLPTSSARRWIAGAPWWYRRSRWAGTLLYYLWQLRSAGRLPDIPVYLDSPMAINASELLGTHRADHRPTPEVYEGMCAMAAYTRRPTSPGRSRRAPSPRS